ncbi:hypothetical protein J4E91_003111 [Alternaria rosae]|nr:hypothetical protein J4E91_003111 [Alternaria rosae]
MPHDLVKHITPPPLDVARQRTFCVFFVTPSYAHYLLDDDAFLRNALLQAYENAADVPDLQIHALCAVVDKLPVSRIGEKNPTQPPLAGAGFEGISYAILPSDTSVPSQELSPSDKSAIDFIFAEHNVEDTVYRDTLRLPLANTVFQTVNGCMGNIIRRVIGPDGKSLQASSELENVVPRFFKSRGQPAQATAAWALVIPDELRAVIAARTDEILSSLPTDNQSPVSEHANAWERLWRSDPPLYNTLVSQALTEGARLHRVLSGGGGWGKKAGLLSLDPAPAIPAADPSKDDDFFSMISDPQDFESTLTPVVRDGDSIQFFISPKSDLEQLAQKSGHRGTIRSAAFGKKINWGWEVGTIPSTVDSIPGELSQHSEIKGDKILSFRGFGALSEGAMTLTQHARVDEGRLHSVTTTVDVPFSRFRTIRKDGATPDDKNEDEDSIHEPNTPKYVPSIRAQVPTPEVPVAVPELSNAVALKEPSRPPPRLTVAELVRKLKIEGQSTSGRLRVRTANAILRRFEKFFDQHKTKHTAVMSEIRQRHCLLMAVRFRTLMVDATDLMEEADSILDGVNRKLVRRVPAKEREKSKTERLERNAEKREKKRAQKAEKAAQEEKRARRKVMTNAVLPTATGAPIRKFASYGMSTAAEINKRLQPAVSEVSRLTEEARAIMAAIQHTKPHIRRMPVSKLATAQAFNQTLGYAVQEILRLTEEARTIMITIRQRKRQYRRQRTQQTRRRRRIRRVSPPVHIVRYPSRSWMVRKKTVPALPKGKRSEGIRTVMQRQPGFRAATQRQSVIQERKQKRDELAATVASWLGGGGSTSND